MYTTGSTIGRYDLLGRENEKVPTTICPPLPGDGHLAETREAQPGTREMRIRRATQKPDHPSPLLNTATDIPWFKNINHAPGWGMESEVYGRHEGECRGSLRDGVAASPLERGYLPTAHKRSFLT